MKATLCCILAAGQIAVAHASTVLEGVVVGVHDGDTLTLLDHKLTQHQIRLAMIDAPEVGKGKHDPGQAFGTKSQMSLAGMVFSRNARAECDDKPERYGRRVCSIYVGNVNVNLEQVKKGMAWVYRKYGRERKYYEAERAAQDQRLGLWADPRPTPPWEWRHQ